MYSARHCSTQVSGIAQRTSDVRPQPQPTHSAQGLHSVSILRGVHCGGVRHTRHARGRSARRPPPSLAADHAAALWQLWWRVGRTTTITCQVVESHALYHRLQRATGAGRGANAGTAQRAGDGGRTYPANQHRVCIHTLSCVRRLTMLVPIGTAFGYGTRTHTLSRTLRSPSIGRAEARATDATRGDSRALLDESTARAGRVDRSWRSSGPVQGASGPRGSGEWESFKGRLDATRGPLARSSGRTGSPLAAGRRSTRCGEAPGAAVDSTFASGPLDLRERSFSGDASRDPLRTINTVGVKHNTTPKETLCRHSIRYTGTIGVYSAKGTA